MCFGTQRFLPFPGPHHGVASPVDWYAMFDTTRLYA